MKKIKKIPEYQEFSIASVWNAAIEGKKRSKPEPRERLWATDMAKAPIDVFLALKGEKQTNPANARARRKFEAGNVFEWIVSIVLLRAGILVSKQERLEKTYGKGLLPMSGKMDFLAGGKINKKQALKDINDMDVPEVFKDAGVAVIKYLAKTFPEGMGEMPLEVKSISSFAADGMERTGKAIEAHRQQLAFYLDVWKCEKGILLYVCRDDLRMFEFIVRRNDKKLKSSIRKFVKMLSAAHKNDLMPAKEDPIIFNEVEGRFSKNLKIEYSAYLKKLYGFRDPREYSAKYSSTISRWNRVMTRIKKGDTMTKNNLEALEEMKAEGFKTDKIIKQFTPDTEE